MAERAFSFNKGRENIQAIKTADDYKIARDNWLGIKQILDAIFKRLSPLETGIKTLSFPENLPESQMALLPSVIENMFSAGIATAQGFNVGVLTTGDEMPQRSSRIVIIDKEAFEDYKREVSRLCEFIEQDGKERFPEIYKATTAEGKSPMQRDVGGDKCYFDKVESVLVIDGKEVPIKRHGKQYELLKVIFTDKTKDWQYEEIIYEIDPAETAEWKKVHNNLNAVKTKIQIKTGIDDFFITTTQSVKINNKYLEEKSEES